MSSNKLSLTKKLDGGYLRVKRRDSNVKKRKGGGYANYLKRTKPDTQTNPKPTLNSLGSDTQKVVAIKLVSPRKKHKRTPEKGIDRNPVNDISESTILPQKNILSGR
jgi:hypothetical protein